MPAGWNVWVVADKERSMIIGDAGFKGAPGPDGIVRIGYSIVPAERGKGYATEALDAMTGWACGKPEVKVIQAQVEQCNSVSIHILKKLGFDRSGDNENIISLVFRCGDQMERCPWAEGNEIYERYHDEEWGVPVHDDRRHFEFLVLEGAQAGLSWITVLKRRDGYRKAFADFDPVEVAGFDEIVIEKLLKDPGIIRNRLKVRSAVNNAKRFIEVQKEFGSFDSYIWSFTGGKTVVNRFEDIGQLPARTDLSDRISKDLKGRGFNFVGSKIIYAHLQAAGIVNDHIVSCFRYRELTRE
jgi:DNA-3-methyladenine glycosylase I